jgi:hypothetical protein
MLFSLLGAFSSVGSSIVLAVAPAAAAATLSTSGIERAAQGISLGGIIMGT